MSTDNGSIKAVVRYTINVGDGKWIVEEGADEGKTLPGERKDYEVTAHNARLILNSLSVHRQGFVFVENTSKVSDFYNDKEVKTVYYPEIESIIRKQFPEAWRVVIFDHTNRSSSTELNAARNIRPHANLVHNDYTDNSGIKRVRDLFPEDAESLLKKRFMIINVWRPLKLVETAPLAFVDSQTTDPEDFLVLQRIMKDRVGEIQQVKYNKKHKWFYFPKMKRNETVVFKTFDSLAEKGVSRFTAHTALNIIDEPKNLPPRESIEVRALVFLSENKSKL